MSDFVASDTSVVSRDTRPSVPHLTRRLRENTDAGGVESLMYTARLRGIRNFLAASSRLSQEARLNMDTALAMVVEGLLRTSNRVATDQTGRVS